MIFIWRGWGLLALVAAFLPLASCAGLMDWSPLAALLCCVDTAVAGGMICRHYGRKWNQGSGFHMMYWIPLEIWGWIYISLGEFFALASLAELVMKRISG
jgi:hypothetical protein